MPLLGPPPKPTLSDVADLLSDYRRATYEPVVIADKSLPRFRVGRYGASPDNDDNAPYLRDAYETVYAKGGGVLLFEPGETYKVTPDYETADEGGPLLTPIVIRSGVQVDGRGATIKINDGVSSPGARVRMGVFFSNGVTSDWAIRRLTFDMNGANNLINPVDGPWVNDMNQAPIAVAGTVDGVAARAENVEIADVMIKNNAGTTCIACAASNTVGVTLGKRWRIRRVDFWNTGLNVSDASPTYLWANDVIQENCRAWNDDPFEEGKGIVAAYEIHGADIWLVNNRVTNAYRAFWIASNLTSAVERVRALGNICNDLYGYGVSFDRNLASHSAITDVMIALNHFSFNDTDVEDSRKAAFSLIAKYGVSRVKFVENTGVKTGTNENSVFAEIAAPAAAVSKHTDIEVSGNEARGFVGGLAITVAHATGLGRVTARDNRWNDQAAAGGSTPVGNSVVVTAGALDSLDLDNNAVDGATYGTKLEGAIAALRYKPGRLANIATAGYDESGATVGARQGDFDSLAYTATLTGVSALGNGARYASRSYRGDLVTVVGRLDVGSTTAFTGGLIAFSLIDAAKNVGDQPYTGTYRITDASAGKYFTGVCQIDPGGSDVTFAVNDNAQTVVNDSTPVALANGDVLVFEITYPRA